MGATHHRPRRLLLLIHRYTGLAIATFIVVAGLTGTLLAFYHDLDAALNPRLYRVDPPAAGAVTLDPFEVRERLAAALPDEMINWLPLKTEPGEALVVWIEPSDPSQDDELFVNPYNGEILGSRRWGDLGQGVRTNLLPFIYRLHYALALGDTGAILFGVVALLWAVDCFVGAWLTFPVGRSSPRRPALLLDWARRWRVSWLIKGGSLFRSLFTFHRAAGLWIWAMLFVFAWSGVGFNLQPVFKPIMAAAFGYTDPWDGLADLTEPKARPALDWRAAHAIATEAMAAEAEQRGFEIRGEDFIQYLPENGLYRFSVHSSLDLSRDKASTRIWIDGDTGSLIAFDADTGVSTGNTLASWLFALHMGAVGGVAYRVVVAVLGLVITGLALSGVYLWWRRRKSHSRGEDSDQTG